MQYLFQQLGGMPMTNIDLRAYFSAGYYQALQDYGIWKDGVQYIGCQNTPIREVMYNFMKNTMSKEFKGNEEMEWALSCLKTFVERAMSEVLEKARKEKEEEWNGEILKMKSRPITN